MTQWVGDGGRGPSGLTNSAAAGAAGVTQWVGHGGRGPSTLRVQAFGGLERDRYASENGTIALSDVLNISTSIFEILFWMKIIVLLSESYDDYILNC